MTTYVGKLLNCGEVENLIREEKEKRRKTRLNQVRHYSRENSYRILSNVRNERKRQLELIRNRLKDEWKKGKEKKLEELSAEYGRCLRDVGNGHRSALIEIAQEDGLKKKSSSDLEKALSRGNDALARLSLERSRLHDKLVQKNSSIQLARQLEKERAKRISSLPLPTSKQPLNDLGMKPKQETDQSIKDNVVVDAREAARLEEERISKQKDKNSAEEVERSIVRANRYSDAQSHFELQKEYNRIMDELEKIVEWEKKNDHRKMTSNVTVQSKEKLIAKQEAIVEELFNRLSIPLVSTDFSCTFPNGSSETTEDETPVHHVLVSSTTLDEVEEISPPDRSDRVDFGVPSVSLESSRTVLSNEASSSSSSISTLNQQVLEGFSIQSNETILASHPNDFLSSVTIDLSTLPISEESSTKFPLSTFETTVNGDSRELSTLKLDESSDSVDERTLEMNVPDSKHDRNDTLQSKDGSDLLSKANSEPKQSQDGPVFLNVAVRRHNLTVDANHLKEQITKPVEETDKSNYLRHLLSLAVQQRRLTEQTVNLPAVSVVKNGISVPPIETSGLEDLKASFIAAQHTLRTELDARKSVRERIVSKGATLTAESVVVNGTHLSLKPMMPPHELSTILEVDTPDSPQRLFQARVEDNLIHTEFGITDEPNLTLVGSDSTVSNISEENSLVFGQSFKMFSSFSTTETTSQQFKTPSTIGTSGSWFDSTKNSSIRREPKQKLIKPQKSLNKDDFKLDKTFQDIVSGISNSFVQTPTISSSDSSNEFFWNSCFSKKLTSKRSSFSSTPLPKPLESPFQSLVLTSPNLDKFSDTLQHKNTAQKSNETSLSYLDSLVTANSSDRDTVRGNDDDNECPMCPSSSSATTDTNGGSSAAFNESLSGSLVSFLRHEHSANGSTIESFSTGLETSSDN